MATRQPQARSTSQVQVRRRPPVPGRIDPSIPALRLVKAAGMATPAPHGWKRLGSLDSASVRIVAGLLLVSIPTSIVLGFLLSGWNTQTLIQQVQIRSEVAAESASDRTSIWVDARRAELRQLARDEAGQVDSPSAAASELGGAAAHPDFANLGVINPAGSLVATTRPGAGMDLGISSTERLQVETLQPIKQGSAEGPWVRNAPQLRLA